MKPPRPRLVSRILYAANRLREAPFLRRDAAQTPRSMERLGQPTRARPEGCLLWVHSRSPADAGASLALARELSFRRGEPVHVLITSAEEALAPPSLAAAIHQFAPGETSGSVARFLDHWKPDLALFLGLPDRPALITGAAERGVPMFLAAANRSTIGTRRRLAYVPATLLGQFRYCLAASAADAEVLRRHLDDNDVHIEVTGPFSDTAHALSCNERERDEIARTLGGRPVWLSAGVTGSEIAFIESAHRRAFRAAHRLLLILVPRELDRGETLAEGLEAQGWQVARRSNGGEPDLDVQIYIADTEDEMGLWYRLAPITFVGGTLDQAAMPGDPFEPAALGSAVLHGPNIGEAPERFQKLDEVGASVVIGDAESLGAAIQTLLAPDKAAELAQAGWAATTESAHVVTRLAELMDAALDEAEAA